MKRFAALILCLLSTLQSGKGQRLPLFIWEGLTTAKSFSLTIRVKLQLQSQMNKKMEEKNMKKWMIIIFSTAAALCLASCSASQASSSEASSNSPNSSSASVSASSSESDSQSAPESSAAGVSLPESSAESDESGSGSGKTLVVYSASGNTKRVAEGVAAADSDTFELIPVTPYTEEDLNWTTAGSRVNLEHDDESLRDIALEADTVENWDDYDTVFIGYPIWWGIAAWPVNGFVEANDFSGKTVIPFCTSASSGLGQSGELLEEMASSGNWLEGVRFRSSASDEEITEWFESLGLD